MLFRSIASYAIGLGNIPWQGVELFPLELRGLGSSMLAGGVWSGNIVVSFRPGPKMRNFLIWWHEPADLGLLLVGYLQVGSQLAVKLCSHNHS